MHDGPRALSRLELDQRHAALRVSPIVRRWHPWIARERLAMTHLPMRVHVP
ncbi:MAG: hypothetical protein QOK44_729, partial [Betaproteobacteria bacterium]|nr:hypothetical protein [Betaproteobacteria bacterium]